MPALTTHLSAKTDWNLRRKRAVTTPGCAGGVNFTGATQLRGGDIDPAPTMGCDNVVNFGDYSLMVSHWLESVAMVPAAAVADINGDGVINIFDYGILGSNWFTCGDPE